MAVSSGVKISIVGILGFIICTLGVVLYFIFPTVIRNKISQNLRIVNGTDLYESWREAPIPIYMQFYLFNVTNSEEFLSNSSVKPVLQQLGPYTFREYREKINIEFDDTNSTVAYEQRKWFIFEPNMTKGSLEDPVTTLNVPIVALAAKAEGKLGAFMKMMINNFIKMFKTSMFVTKTVDELLYTGYKDDLMIYLAEKSGKETLPNGTFGFVYGQNYSTDGVYSIHTGVKDPSKYPTIKSWNSSSSVPYWNDTYCDMINGTDGSSFTPFLTRDMPVRVFSTDLCRSIYMLYDGDTEVHGIKTYRYDTPFSLLADPSINPDNECFCKGEICSLSGLLNISACKKGAPVILSPVHFYQSDPYLLKTVVGLKPSKEEHDTVMDVEPTTGVVLKAARRVQINIAIQPSKDIRLLKNTPHMIFPVLWVNESADIGSEKAELFKAKIFKPMLIGKAITYALIAIGAFLMAIAIIFCIRLNTQNKKLIMDSPTKLKPHEKAIMYKNNSQFPQDEVNHALLNKYPSS